VVKHSNRQNNAKIKIIGQNKIMSIRTSRGSGGEVHHPTILGLLLGLGDELRVRDRVRVKVRVRVRVSIRLLGLGLGLVSWVVNFSTSATTW